MVFKTNTLSPNVNIQVTLRIWMGMLKMGVLMLVVDIFLKIATLSPNVKIQVPLSRWIGMLRSVIVMWIVDILF